MPFLLALTGPYTGQAFEVKDGRTTVGRGPACNLILEQDAAISRAHAMLVSAGGVIQVHDAGSTHGVYVNGRRVDQALLHTGDCVQFGGSSFQVQPVPAQVSDAPRLRVVLPRSPMPAAGGQPGPGGAFLPDEKVVSPAMGCLMIGIAILIPIPYGVHVGRVYLRKSHPSNQRFGWAFLVSSLLSLVVQVVLTILTVNYLRNSPLLRQLLGAYQDGTGM